jgi:GntR family transcriptional regulator, transcriptional repressor for pyruvate dehydrogenase complex
MTATDAALAGLRAMIARGDIAPGQRFPPEAELCVRFGVSRSSLREAARILSTLGVVDVRHGSGMYVSRLDPADVVRGFSLTVDLLPLDGLLQLLEIRRVLESHASAQAAARASGELIARLHDLTDRMEAAIDLDELGRLDRAFHEAICDAGGNPTVSSLMEVFRSRGGHYRIMTGDAADPVRRASDEGHRAIVAAIGRRDPAAAATAAAAHVAQTEYWLSRMKPAPDSEPATVEPGRGRAIADPGEPSP